MRVTDGADLHHPQLLADPPPPAVMAPLAVCGPAPQLRAEQGLGAAPPTAPPPGPVGGRAPAGAEPARALLSLRRAAHSDKVRERDVTCFGKNCKLLI